MVSLIGNDSRGEGWGEKKGKDIHPEMQHSLISVVMVRSGAGRVVE